MVIIQFSFLRGMILQDRKRLFFSEWKITNQSLEWLGYSWFFYLCVCCPPLIFAGASRRHLNLWCVSVMFIPHCLSDPTSSYAFFVDGISPEGFSCDPKSMIYIYIVLITCPISCTLPSGTTLTVASYHICGKHAFERCVFSIIILIKGFPLPPFPLNASASLQTKEDLGSCAGEKCAAEMHMAISTSRWHPKTNRSTCAMVTTWLVSLKGE